MASSTSSIRLPDDLRIRLETLAHSTKKGKNWIVKQALQDYLDRNSQEGLILEARRQSLLAGKKKWKDEAFWGKLASEVLRDR